MRIHFSLEECGAPHALKMTVTDPDGKDLGLNVTSPLSPAVPEYPSDSGASLFAAFGVGFLKFEHLGVHAVNVFVNDNQLEGFTFGIHRTNPSDQGGN